MCSQSLATGPVPSPEAGLDLIPALAWGSPSQLAGQVWAPHPSGCFSLPYLGCNHCQPICENHPPQGRRKGRHCWQADRLHTSSCLLGHFEAMAGSLGFTSTPSCSLSHLSLSLSYFLSGGDRSKDLALKGVQGFPAPMALAL